MALYLKSWIDDYRTIYNPIEFVLEETNATLLAYPGFKYVVDVYDGATLLGRLKIPMDTTNYGRADVHGICESYLTTNLGTIGSTDAFADNPQSWKTFTFKFGEVYYNTSTEAWVTDYAMTYDKDGSSETSEAIIIFNGSLPNYRGTVVNFYDWQTPNYYQNYTVTAATRKWLTNAPRGATPVDDNTTKVELTDEGWLYFLYDDVSNPITKVILTTYLAGVGVANHNINLTAGATDNHIRLACAPTSINNIAGSPPYIPSSGVDAYSLTLYDNASQASEPFYFSITSECRYETRRIEFLNSLGGFDFFNFTKVSRMIEDIERKFYKQNEDNMVSGEITYDISDRQKTQYYTASKPKMKLTSDWVSVDQFNFLLEMLSSPEIYLHEGGKRIPVQNIDGNWEQKLSTVDTVFNLEITLEFGMDNYRQRW